MSSKKNRNSGSGSGGIAAGRRWLVRPVVAASSREKYASLLDEESGSSSFSSSHRNAKAKRRALPLAVHSVTPSPEQAATAKSSAWPRQGDSVMNEPPPPLQQHKAAPAHRRNIEPNSQSSSVKQNASTFCSPVDEDDAFLKPETLLNWNALRLDGHNRQSVDEDDDEEDTEDDDNMLYMADYYGKGTFPSNTTCKKSNEFFEKHTTSRVNRLPPPRRLRLPPSTAQRRKNKRLDMDEAPRMELSTSFETQETQLEEASETSVSTTETDESDMTPASSKQSSTMARCARSVRWLDQVQVGQELATIHVMEYDMEATCRVVILLLMDHGPQSAANNFEFLHCEFRQDDRLRVSDALQQITEIVLGTPEAPKLPVDIGTLDEKKRKSSASSSSSSFRPFTRLCFDGKELINMFALQDYYLEDGRSILVAIREGSKDRDMLLKQSALLLADKRLRRGIRKARIAGRSLQPLYGIDGIEELAERKQRAAALGKDYGSLVDHADDDESNCEDDETDDEYGMDDKEHPWSAFDNLSLTSFDDDEFGDASFDTNTSSLSSNWLDDDFFDNKEFFRANSLSKSKSLQSQQQQHQPFAALNPNGLGWASFEFDPEDDHDENLFSTIDVSFDVDVCGIVPSGQASEKTLTFHGVRNRRAARTTSVNV